MNTLVLCGFMGCGKSTVGRQLAAATGMTYVDMDAYIEEQAGCTVRELFAREGEAAFRRREHDACVALGAAEGLIIATGGGAVLREDNVEALHRNGIIVWLTVTADCVLERLAGDTTRPLLMREDKDAAVRSLLAEREPLYRRAADVCVDGTADAATVAEAVLEAVKASGIG